ncbi:MAG: tetratricopeptide repeat protein [Planctomycetota bacterium]
MRKALWLLALISVVGCSSGKKTEQAEATPAAAPVSTPSVANTSSAGVTAETKPLIEQATQLIKKRDFGKAFEQLNAAIKADAKCAAAYFMRAGIFADAGQNTRSLADFNTAIGLDTKNADFYNARGFFYLTRQQFPESVKDFSQAIQLSPMHAQACNNRGLAHVALGQFKPAIADFTEALKLGPQNFDAYNNRGFAYFQAGDSEKALVDFNSAVRLNPESLNAYNNRGLLYFKGEKYAEAAAEFTEAIQRDRMNAKYYRHRREAYLKAGMEDEARVDLVKINWLQELARVNQIATRSPKDAEIWVQRANHLVAGDEFETAVKDFKTALQLNPKSAAVHIGLAQMHLKQGDSDKALAECTLASELGAQSEVASIRGDIYLKLSKLDEAIVAYEEAQRFDAKVAEAYLLRSKQRQTQGQAQAADEDFRQAVALDPSLEGARQ